LNRKKLVGSTLTGSNWLSKTTAAWKRSPFMKRRTVYVLCYSIPPSIWKKWYPFCSGSIHGHCRQAPRRDTPPSPSG
jgi:hypothetical protein